MVTIEVQSIESVEEREPHAAAPAAPGRGERTRRRPSRPASARRATLVVEEELAGQEQPEPGAEPRTTAIAVDVGEDEVVHPPHQRRLEGAGPCAVPAEPVAEVLVVDGPEAAGIDQQPIADDPQAAGDDEVDEVAESPQIRVTATDHHLQIHPHPVQLLGDHVQTAGRYGRRRAVGSLPQQRSRRRTAPAAAARPRSRVRAVAPPGRTAAPADRARPHSAPPLGTASGSADRSACACPTATRRSRPAAAPRAAGTRPPTRSRPECRRHPARRCWC